MPPGRLVLLRHGRTAWAAAGRHTGRTDVPLDEVGRSQARSLGAMLERRTWAAVVTSPLERARGTAELAGLAVTAVDPDLVEWDYGGYEGLTTPEIRERLGTDWTVVADGVVAGRTPGETLAEVATRAASALARIRPALAHGDVVLVSHGHLLRVLTTVWVGLPPAAAAHLELDPASVSELSEQHGVPTIRSFNVPADQIGREHSA